MMLRASHTATIPEIITTVKNIKKVSTIRLFRGASPIVYKNAEKRDGFIILKRRVYFPPL